MTLHPTVSARHWLLMLVLLAAASAAAMVTPVDAAIGHRAAARMDMGRPIVTARGEMSLDAAVAMVRQRFGGKIISARTIDNRGRPVHVIKVLSSEGRVTTVRVDAKSGRIQ